MANTSSSVGGGGSFKMGDGLVGVSVTTAIATVPSPDGSAPHAVVDTTIQGTVDGMSVQYDRTTDLQTGATTSYTALGAGFVIGGIDGSSGFVGAGVTSDGNFTAVANGSQNYNSPNLQTAPPFGNGLPTSPISPTVEAGVQFTTGTPAVDGPPVVQGPINQPDLSPTITTVAPNTEPASATPDAPITGGTNVEAPQPGPSESFIFGETNVQSPIPGPTHCFSRGTLVEVASGSEKAIECLIIGELVSAFVSFGPDHPSVSMFSRAEATAGGPA